MEHRARLFNDHGVASHRGWYIIHSETCNFPDAEARCNEVEDVAAITDAVRAIYDAHPWPYPVGLWPVPHDAGMNKEFEFSLTELRTHLETWMESQNERPKPDRR